MTFPDVPDEGIYLDRYHRYFFNGTGPVVSVTTACKVIASEGLVGWAKREVAQTAVSHAAEIAEHRAHDEPWKGCVVCARPDRDAAAWLASTPDHIRDTAATFGTKIHGYAEEAAYGVDPEALTDEERPFFEAYQRWRAEVKPEEIEAECAVITPWDYAGTVDLIARINGRIVMVDYKSGNYVPDSLELQLAGYGRAVGIARPGKRVLDPLPRIERYAVLHIRPEKYPDKGYDFRYIPVLPRHYERFMDAVRLWHWKKAKDDEWRKARKTTPVAA